MKKIKKLAAFIMAAVLLVTAFSGCGKQEVEQTDTPDFVYVPTYQKFEMPEDVNWVNQLQFIGGKIFFVAEGTAEGKEMVYEDGSVYKPTISVNKLFSVNTDGTELTEIMTVGYDNYWEETGGYNENINSVSEGVNGVTAIVSETETYYDLPADFNENTDYMWNYERQRAKYYFVPIGEDGSVGEKTLFYETENLYEDYFYPERCICDAEGNWYIGTWNQIRVYDSAYNEIAKIDVENGINGLVKLKDGSVAANVWGSESYVLCAVDAKAQKLSEEEIVLPNNVYSANYGGGIYDFIYGSSNGNSLLAYDIATGESVKIVDWLDSDVDASGVYADRISIVDEETIVAFEEVWKDSGTSYNIITLKKTPYSEIKQKEIITLAAIYLDYDVRTRILEFNKTNPDYRIRVTDYSEYASGEDYLGLTKLNTEIISGNIPDIFITRNMPVAKYAGKGVFEDLVPYIENDMGWDSLVEPFLKALMNDEGKLYEIYDSFSVNTYMGLKNVVGDGSSWTFDDLKEAFAKLPEGATVFESDFTKETAFYYLFSNSIDQFVDWETGECRFNTEEFIDILEFTENFPLTFEYTDDYYMYNEMSVVRLINGKQLISRVNLYNFSYVRGNTFYLLGDQTAFVGLPTNEGMGHTFNLSGAGYAISSTCKNKDVAWDFIKVILTEEYWDDKYIGNFPTNKAVFERLAKEEMTPTFDEFYEPTGIMSGTYSGEEVAEDTITFPDYVKGQVNEQGWHEAPKNYGYIESNGVYYDIPIFAMTEQEYQEIMNVIENTTKISRYDDSVMNIVNEEVAYFFNGERTAQQTAEYIQSRVNLYVNEQK